MFYNYRQNNSSGWFQNDDKVGVNVIIEANSAKEADQLAQEKAGIYFGGGRDCNCCEDRWSEQWDNS